MSPFNSMLIVNSGGMQLRISLRNIW